jgi:hypothetical protein
VPTRCRPWLSAIEESIFSVAWLTPQLCAVID